MALLTIGDQFPAYSLTALIGGDLSKVDAKGPDDFFTTITDMDVRWAAKDDEEEVFVGTVGGKKKWLGTRVDLAFGSNAELRALSEVYGADDAEGKFVDDFVAAWVKVMDNDRFDLHG